MKQKGLWRDSVIWFPKRGSFLGV